ncbi:MAG: hypothetical protein QOD99_1425, partial [Chthoniobacter sp.]|nr:hypothetical protein [Chthoniobacter sp.]
MTTISHVICSNASSRRALPYLIALLVAVLPWAARATIYTIDSTQSSLVLSGSLAGNAIQQQGPGSLSTFYSGTIDAVSDALTLRFNSATDDALINGIWQPAVSGTAGTASADYGAQASFFGTTGFGAVRNFIFSIASGTLTRTGNSFDASQLTLSTTSGNFDYNVSAFSL